MGNESPFAPPRRVLGSNSELHEVYKSLSLNSFWDFLEGQDFVVQDSSYLGHRPRRGPVDRRSLSIKFSTVPYTVGVFGVGNLQSEEVVVPNSDCTPFFISGPVLL